MVRRRHCATEQWVVMVFFVVLITSLSGCSDNGAKKDATRASDFTLKDLSGREVSLSDFRGKVVLLDFWATWCSPCRASIPHLNGLSRKYRERGLEILGINLDQGDPGPVLAFRRAMKIEYPILSGTPEVMRAYGINPIPASFLIDRRGNIRAKLIGFNTAIEERMTLEIENLLNED
jgi:thiol-disulfide isomerase/thioredoxin